MRGHCRQAKRWHSPTHVCPSFLLCLCRIACEIFYSICTCWKALGFVFVQSKTHGFRTGHFKIKPSISHFYMNAMTLCICGIPLIPNHMSPRDLHARKGSILVGIVRLKIKKKTLTSNVIPISPENSFSDSGLAQKGAMGYIEITPWKISAYDFYSRVQ